jgi:CheY-like chemotaxis protein
MSDLEGLRVLLVEDEGPVAMLVEDMLQDLGCRVAASVASVPDALRAISQNDFEFALLDVNLAGVKVDPVAEELARRGTPFAFASGYGKAGLRQDLQERPVVQKPFRKDELGETIRLALKGPDPSL